MTTHYGPLRLPEPRLIQVQHKTVDPLPSADTPLPRRQHRGVCMFLTIGGKPADFADFRRCRSGGTTGSDITDAYCAMRPGGVEGAYVLDVCVTSWHHNPQSGESCPFFPAQEAAA